MNVPAMVDMRVASMNPFCQNKKKKLINHLIDDYE